MISIFEIFSNRAWQDLTVALLHTIWQGALAVLLLSVALRRLPAYRHDARYLLALAAQFGVLVAGLATWSILEYEPASTTTGTARAPLLAAASRPIASSPGAAEPTAAPRGETGSPRRTSILAVGWLSGVAIMLVRTAGSVWSASTLARGPRVHDPAILAMVGRIREELRIHRLIRVVEAGVGCGPAVLGVLWPTLLLPASAMTGLPADTLRAILIHELAHIRRYDYLINIAQMVVEAVLFFNPSVWWLGRQARLEREACCDATAVRLTGRPIEYSRSLAEWAGRPHGVAVAAAWAGDRRTGTLLERVRRVLRPGDRPAARVSPSGLLLLLLGGPLMLVVLWRGTTAAVELAAQVLSPAERIQRLEAVQAEYAPAVANPDGKGTLRGTIRTADGKPPARPVWLYHKTDRPGGGGIMGNLAQSRGEFSGEVPAGTTWLTVTPDDHAPAIVGPFDVRPGQTIDGIRIVLEDGSPTKVAVTDGRGRPVAGARVSAYLTIDGRSSLGGTTNGWIADRNGIATIPHALVRPYHVSVEAHGYEPLERVTVTLSPERPAVVALTPTVSSRGVALDPQGHPVAGAEVRLFLEAKQGSIRSYHVSGPLLATTDEVGRFSVDSLKARTRYTLLVTSKAGGRGIITGVRAGQDGLRATVGPNLTITGTLRSSPDEKEKGSRPTAVNVTQFVEVGDDMDRQDHLQPVAWRIPVDAGGHFTITHLFPSDTTLEAGGRMVRLTPIRPETSVTIDLGRPAPRAATRRVALRVATPDGVVPPSGSLHVDAFDAGSGPPVFSRELPIEQGRVTFDAPAPGRISYELRSMVGYWFQNDTVRVEPGEDEQIITLAVEPAGAIAGQVLDADGQPAVSGISVSCRAVEPAPGEARRPFALNNLRVDARGRFFISPLPLGGAYAVVAGRVHNRQFGPTVRLDASKPTERVTLKLARTAVAEGCVVGPDGRPLAGIPVKLELVHATDTMGWDQPITTGADGRFRFDDLSTELDGYRAIVEATEGYQPNAVALRPGAPPVEIRFERGHVLAGRVLDAKTGWPIPGVTVYAERPEWIPGQRNHYEAEGKTDEQGRFRFSNLPEDSWRLNDRNGLEWESPHRTHAFGVDGPEPIDVRATLPRWSHLRPRAPLGD